MRKFLVASAIAALTAGGVAGPAFADASAGGSASVCSDLAASSGDTHVSFDECVDLGGEYDFDFPEHDDHDFGEYLPSGGDPSLPIDPDGFDPDAFGHDAGEIVDGYRGQIEDAIPGQSDVENTIWNAIPPEQRSLVRGFLRQVQDLTETGLPNEQPGIDPQVGVNPPEAGDPGTPEVGDPADLIAMLEGMVAELDPQVGSEPGENPPPSEGGDTDRLDEQIERLTALIETHLGEVQGEIEVPEGDDFGPGEGQSLYRWLVEDVAGQKVHEDTTQCRQETEGLDYTTTCWADDYLLGQYVGDYLVDDYLERYVPAAVHGPLSEVAHTVIDTVLGVTNGEGPSVPSLDDAGAPGVPDAPVDTPETPALPIDDTVSGARDVGGDVAGELGL